MPRISSVARWLLGGRPGPVDPELVGPEFAGQAALAGAAPAAAPAGPAGAASPADRASVGSAQ